MRRPHLDARAARGEMQEELEAERLLAMLTETEVDLAGLCRAEPRTRQLSHASRSVLSANEERVVT